MTGMTQDERSLLLQVAALLRGVLPDARAVAELTEGMRPVEGRYAPYGYCPVCGHPGETRDRRVDGNDRCGNGHAYKSTVALPVAA